MNLSVQLTLLLLALAPVYCHDEIYTLRGFLDWLQQFETSYVGPNSAYRSQTTLREVAHAIRSLVPELDNLKHRYLLFGVYGLEDDPSRMVGADKSAVPSNLYDQQSVNKVPPEVREHLRQILDFKLDRNRDRRYTVEGVFLVPYADGTSDTVAAEFLVMGICAGLEYNRAANFNLESINNLVTTTVGELLVTSALRSRNGTHGGYVGPSGAWDNTRRPHQFTLNGNPSPAIDAQIRGAIDGFLIGKKLSKMSKAWRDGYSLPAIIKNYYGEESKYRFYNFYQNLDRLDLEDEVYRRARIESREEACGTSGMYDLAIMDCPQDDTALRRATDAAVDKFYSRYMPWSTPLEIAKGASAADRREA